MAALKVFFVSLLLLAAPAIATDSQNICLNATTAYSLQSLQITDNTGLIPLDINQTTTCAEGCSTTLGNCRNNLSGQGIEVFLIITGFIGLIILSGYVSQHTNSLSLGINAIVALFSVILGAVVDVYSGTFQTIFLVFCFLPVGVSIISILNNRNKGEEEE
jgi:hypothetical protein